MGSGVKGALRLHRQGLGSSVRLVMDGANEFVRKGS
jgi:hypothetical protein